MKKLTKDQVINIATNFDEFGFNATTLIPEEECDRTIKDIHNAFNELIKYKDIEEELDIDLITLFMALKQGYIYEKLEDEITKRDIDMLDFREGIRGVCLDKSYGIDNYKQCYQTLKYINGYGKSWALTKEELEENKK